MHESIARGFDPHALVAEVDQGDLERFREHFPKTGVPAVGGRRRLVEDTVLRGVLCLAIFACFVLVAWVPLTQVGLHPLVAAVAGLIVLAIPALLTWLLFRPIMRRWRIPRPWIRWYRLSGFADDNGLDFRPEIESPRHVGLMFQQGRHRRILESFATPEGSFEAGTFTFVPKSSYSHSGDPAYGFLRIALPRQMPHLVLISISRRGIRGFSSVGLAFSERQRVRLEGDFDDYFAVYAPNGYEADLRYVLTPDVMARLADHAARFDLEFVDDQLYVYSETAWDLEQWQTWDWALRFAELVGVPAVRRTSRFADGRSSDPGRTVAPAGRRLKVAVPLVATLLVVGWLLFNVVGRVLFQIAQ